LRDAILTASGDPRLFLILEERGDFVSHVTLTGTDYKVPAACACCGGATDEIRKFEKKEMLFLVVVLITKSAQVSLPYCRACQDHATWHKGGGWLGVGLLGLVAFIGWVCMGFIVALIVEMGWAERHFAESTKGVVLSLSIAVLATALSVWLRARKRPRDPLSRNHAGDKWAVEIVSFDKKSMRLRLDSLPFAKAFLELNPSVAKRG
jgi:hypothetical protein